MRNPTGKKVANFVWKELICRHGVFGEIRVDGGPEFKAEVITELRKLGAGRRIISAYNSKGNGMAERGHQPVIDALLALTDGGKKSWIPFIPWLMLTLRTMVHAPTGYTPFYLTHGREAVLPVETRYPTWRILDWGKVHDTASLIAMRTRQLQMRDEDVEKARFRKDRLRKEGQQQWDERHNLRREPIVVGDLVLTYDVQRIDQDMSASTKLLYS